MTRKPVDPPDEKAARATALALLARRDFCTGELKARLVGKGVDSTLAETLVADLVRAKLVDDARFTENFVAYHAGRGQGPVRIGRDLKGLGIDADLVDRFVSVPDWVARARDVRRKKFGATVPEGFAGKAKQARFLQYRGFTGAQVRIALGTDIDIDDET